MNEKHWKWARERLHGSDHARAEKIERAAIAKEEEGKLHPDFAKELDALARDPARALRLGRFVEGARKNDDLFVDARALLSHMSILGTSGGGKTFVLLLQLANLLKLGVINSAIVPDMKGEATELLTDQVLPAIAASMPPAEADAFLKRIVVIDPFSATHPPPLNVLIRDPGVPVAIQAQDTSQCFEAAIESAVPDRAEIILDWCLRALISLNELPQTARASFLTLRRALTEPLVLDGLVRQVPDREIVRYFVTRFPSEPKASKDALAARLDRFLALPMAQLCLGANCCLDFDNLLRDKIVIVALGKAPAGLQSVARFFAMIILTRIVRAIFRLPPRNPNFASIIAADEWHVALNPALAREFESILELARSRGVYLWLANQQLTQLDRQGTTLRSAVLGLTATQFVFRMAPDDARALKFLFPVTGTRRRYAGSGSSSSPFLSPSEEVEARTMEATRLPNRVGYFIDKRKDWGAVLMRSATLDLPPTSSLPPSYVARARRGGIGFTTADLAKMAADEDARLDALAAGPAVPPPANALALLGASPPMTPAPMSSATPSTPVPAAKARRGNAKRPKKAGP